MRLTNIEVALRATNWPLLREQKEWLVNNRGEGDGLLHFLDAIQDAAVADGIATATEVFGALMEKKD